MVSYQKQGLSVFPIGIFTPRVDVERDAPYLPAHPQELIQQKRFNAVPYISGLNQHEGLLFVACKKVFFFKFCFNRFIKLNYSL